MDDRVLGVIPARGGSKRVPRKNIRQIGGKPLIAHVIEATNAAEQLDSCVVSTDDAEIRDIAVEQGADAPFRRPAKLATDTATSDAVVEHALDWFEDRGESFQYVLKIQATNPFQTAADIDDAIEQLISSTATSIISVGTYDSPVVWALERDAKGFLSSHAETDHLWGESPARSQDLPEFVHPNGAFFGAAVESFRKAGSFYTARTLGYEMPPERSLDIDTPFDFDLAKAWMAHR